MNNVHEFVKMLTVETIQAALDDKLYNVLGYSNSRVTEITDKILRLIRER